MKNRVIIFSFFLALLMGLSPLAGTGGAALAAPQVELHVCSSGCTYTTVQAAVDAASAGAVIKIAAGIYSGVSLRSGATQVVYINKAVSLLGGFTSSNWTSADPLANPTTIDAQGLGRVLNLNLHTADVTIDGLRLVNGDASAAGSGTQGGGVYGLGWDKLSTVTLRNSQIVDNTAQSGGGGLSLWQFNIVVTGNTFSGNHGKKNIDGNLTQGGAALITYSTAQITNNQFSSNTVPMGDYYGDAGGALYFQDSTATLTGNTFTGNQANEGGGLAALRSPLTLTSNQFTSNTANQGGGIYYGADNSVSSNISMESNVFYNNNAGDGAGAWVLCYQSTITSNTFDLNTATGKGGGLVSGGSLIVIQNNRFKHNTSGSQAGGLYLAGAPQVKSNLIMGNTSHYGGGVTISGYGSSHPVLTNNMIVDNVVVNIGVEPTGVGRGSAVYVEGELADLVHTTIARNTGGDGSSIYATNAGSRNSTLAITNTILANEAVGISVQSGSQAAINGILWYATPTTVLAVVPGSVTVQHEYTGDPMFTPDGQHILKTSLAVDHGVDAGVVRDFDGQPRPNGPLPDLGADEWNPPNIYLPKLVR